MHVYAARHARLVQAIFRIAQWSFGLGELPGPNQQQRIRLGIERCITRLDLGAIAGFHGRRETKAARHLLESGLATAVATDAHQVGDLQQAAAGLAWIDKKLGHATTVRLFADAPRAILGGELPD